jgi:soluble lytic murein transglycosylase-like protein
VPARPTGPPAAVPDSGKTDKAPAPLVSTPSPPPLAASTSEAICLLVESAAQAHGLPFEFFARLIWQESRFQPNCGRPDDPQRSAGPGHRPVHAGTASERGLFDPFDPVSALPKSAEFLEELHTSFGNLGLAAAAYNAGPRRVRDWLKAVAGCRPRPGTS